MRVNANEGFVIFLTCQLHIWFIGGFTSKMKAQLIGYLLNGREHIYWLLDLDGEMHTQYELYEQVTFKNARAILFFAVAA
jgi:hypothetical protein